MYIKHLASQSQGLGHFLLLNLQHSAQEKHLIVFCTLHSFTSDDCPALEKALESEPQFFNDL